MTGRKHKLPPNPARLIEGLRDTGYDFNTALADIVDNSVDAGATLVEISMHMDDDGDVLLCVGDNGCGMDEDTLLDGMTYGASGRVDPKRLGKFGLGLKTASTAFCRCLSVVTRPSAEVSPLRATWDLDHVIAAEDWELLLEEPAPWEVELLDDVAPSSSGTLVTWTKTDRVMRSYANPTGAPARTALRRMITGFKAHAAMIYQRFLDQTDTRARDIRMLLNGEEIQPWDPFCRGEEQTERVASENVAVDLPDGRESSFEISAYVIPRREHFSTDEAAKNARVTNDMQGIYIYRENRLIHPADWLGMFRKEPHGTLLRVEFSFDHTLDEAFQVDIKKSRILLNNDLYNFVSDRFLPAPRNAANERYRKGRRAVTAKKAQDAHADSNRSIGSQEEDLRIADIEVTDAASGEVSLTNRQGQVTLRLSVGTRTESGQVHVQSVDSIDDGLLCQA